MMASSLGRNILVVATSIALVAVVAGVIVLDTPAEARQGQLDRERVSHLQGIMRGTDGFLTRYERLPASMMELRSIRTTTSGKRSVSCARLKT